MIIKVKTKDVELSIAEDRVSDRVTSIKWQDQCERVKETIIVMAEQAEKLQKVHEGKS